LRILRWRLGGASAHQHWLAPGRGRLLAQPPLALRGFCTSASSSSASACATSEVPSPTPEQLKRVFTNSAVPFVGFGIVDQSVLIYAGDAIDATLGVSLGLPTLGAAACGQIFSDTSGVLFGGTIEALALKLGLPLPGLTEAQTRLGIVKRVSTFGSVCGVILGCLIGMCNLFVVDLHAAERAKRAEELKTIMKAVMEDGRNVMGCARATLWIVDEEKNELWSSIAHGENKILRIPSDEKTSIAGWVYHHRELANIPDVKEDPRWYRQKLGEWAPTSMICAPVITGDKVIAVIQLLDKTDDAGNIIPFDVNDEKMMTMLAGHTRIFMNPDDD